MILEKTLERKKEEEEIRYKCVNCTHSCCTQVDTFDDHDGAELKFCKRHTVDKDR